MHQIICKFCNVQVESVYKKRQFCSIKCSNSYKNKIVQKTFIIQCKNCNKECTKYSKTARFCSYKCAALHSRITLICNFCNKEYLSFSKKHQVCSLECRDKLYSQKTKHADVIIQCKYCNNKVIVPYSKRKKLYCSLECTSLANLKNVTSESFIKANITRKNNIDSGKVKNHWIGRKHSEKSKEKTRKTRKEKGLDNPENNPMYGKHHSAESKEAMSTTRSKYIIDGKYNGWFKKGNYFSTKLNKEINYQSSWELSYYKQLDNDNNVLTYLIQPMRLEYFYLQKRNYIPDILVTYINKNQKLIEIKPNAFLESKINICKFKAAEEYCNKKGIIFEIWTELKNPYFSKKELFTYKNKSKNIP